MVGAVNAWFGLVVVSWNVQVLGKVNVAGSERFKLKYICSVTV
jgi:hypothetical protein